MRWWWDEYKDVVHFLGVVAVIGIVIIGGVAVLTTWAGDKGCESACRLDGDESVYQWDAGCYCVDEHGTIYNPKMRVKDVVIDHEIEVDHP